LVILRMGIEGIFLSGLITSAATLLMLLPTIVRHLVIGMNSTLWKALIKFGLPSVPAGLAGIAIQVVDRPILRALTDDATVGVYQANYRLGIFMMLIVSMYDYAWRPFYFSVVKETNAKEIFARVLTYLLFGMIVIFLFLTFFIEDIAKVTVGGRHFIHPNYWSGLNIVPIVLLGYLFLGLSTNLSAGIYIEKKTKYLPVITIAGAVVNIGVNIFLIPLTGMLGAAWATLVAYFIMALLTYIFVQRIYPVKYEFIRIAKVIAAVAIVLAIYLLSGNFALPYPFIVIYKCGLLALFLLLVYLMRFFKNGELLLLKRLILKIKNGTNQNLSE
jgi:O-antigen/teichoic acid export membrane protein